MHVMKAMVVWKGVLGWNENSVKEGLNCKEA
jgi:hypothetical protein